MTETQKIDALDVPTAREVIPHTGTQRIPELQRPVRDYTTDVTGRKVPAPIHADNTLPSNKILKHMRAWNSTPRGIRERIDQRLLKAIEEVAAVGNKWARRTLAALRSGRFDYYYDGRITGRGLALGDDFVILNPIKRIKADGTVIYHSPDSLASTLIHEFVHRYKGFTIAGIPKTGYNEIRAFWAEALFNRDLARIRGVGNFDDSALKELNVLLGVELERPGGQSLARGLEMRKNLQEGLVERYPYGVNYQDNINDAIANLSTYKGGSLRGLRRRLQEASEHSQGQYMDRLIKRLQEERLKAYPEKVTYAELVEQLLKEGGKVRPSSAPPLPPLGKGIAPAPPTIEYPKGKPTIEYPAPQQRSGPTPETVEVPAATPDPKPEMVIKVRALSPGMEVSVQQTLITNAVIDATSHVNYDPRDQVKLLNRDPGDELLSQQLSPDLSRMLKLIQAPDEIKIKEKREAPALKIIEEPRVPGKTVPPKRRVEDDLKVDEKRFEPKDLDDPNVDPARKVPQAGVQVQQKQFEPQAAEPKDAGVPFKPKPEDEDKVKSRLSHLVDLSLDDLKKRRKELERNLKKLKKQLKKLKSSNDEDTAELEEMYKKNMSNAEDELLNINNVIVEKKMMESGKGGQKTGVLFDTLDNEASVTVNN